MAHWKQDENIKFTIMYCGMRPIPDLMDEFGRSKCAIYSHAYGLNLTHLRRSHYHQLRHEKSLECGKESKGLIRRKIDELRKVSDEDDWKIYAMRKTTNMSTKEIGDELALTFAQVQNRVSSKGLGLHPPQGEPPEWFDKSILSR